MAAVAAGRWLGWSKVPPGRTDRRTAAPAGRHQLTTLTGWPGVPSAVPDVKIILQIVFDELPKCTAQRRYSDLRPGRVE